MIERPVVSAVVSGMADVKVGGRHIGTVERSMGDPCRVPLGHWFAYPVDSAAEMLGNQWDRAAHAVCVGASRRECVERFMEWREG